MSQKITLEVTPEDLASMVEAAVRREVARRMGSERLTQQLIRDEVEHVTRAAVQAILRESLPGTIESWLGAREGWIAKLLTRARKGVPDV